MRINNLRILLFLVSTFISLHSTFADAFPPAPVLQTGLTTCYNPTGNEINCAGTGQDGEMQNGLRWPSPRFIDRNDGTIKDNLTGLLWLKNANCFGAKSLEEAVTSANTLASGTCDLTDGSSAGQWRLPNINEYQSLVDISHFSPALPLGHPFNNLPTSPNWSSTYSMNFLEFDLSGGRTYPADGSTSFLWPVRDDNGTSSYLPKTGQTISYIAGDDGALQKGVQWPAPRFTDNNDGSVTDNLTGLIWLQDASCFTARTWADSLTIVNALASGNCGLTDGSSPGDWKLPNVNELESILSAELYNSVLPAKHPFSISKTLPGIYWDYWSSSTIAANRPFAWTVNMSTGNMIGRHKSEYYWIWPVRSKQYWEVGSLLISIVPKFGTHFSASPISPHEVEIGNRGSTPQAISSVTISDTDFAEFSITSGGSNPCTSLSPTLAAGASCTLLLRFNPVSSGVKNATLVITANSSTNSIPLTGTVMATVYGSVTDLATGLPVSGATVTLNTSVTTTTGADGNYAFGNLPAATYSISVANYGYQTTTKNNLTVSATSSAKADILLPTTGPLNITTTALPWASPNIAYSSRVMVTGGTAPYVFKKAYGTLPTGLSLDTSTGVISGTPSGFGSYTFTIGVTDSVAGYAEIDFTLDVVAPLLITTANLPSGQQGTMYSCSLTANGGKPSYSFTVDGVTLPDGITLDASGVLSGTPRKAGSFSVTVKVIDSTGRIYRKPYTLILSAAPALTLDSTTLPTGFKGSAYSTTLSASGGVAPRTFSVTGTLPTGLYFDPNIGTISGTPTTAGLSNLTLTVTDNSYPTPQSVTKTLGLRIWASQPYTLSVTLNGSGSGTVTSDSGGIACTSGTCTAELPGSATVNLLATPNSISLLGGWTGDCNGAGDCSLIMTSNRSVTAIFNLADKAKIGTSSYNSLNAAYLAATNGTIILTLEDELTEDLTINKLLTLIGGYNTTYTSRTGQPTELKGILTIGTGSLTVDGFAVK